MCFPSETLDHIRPLVVNQLLHSYLRLDAVHVNVFHRALGDSVASHFQD